MLFWQKLSAYFPSYFNLVNLAFLVVFFCLILFVTLFPSASIDFEFGSLAIYGQ